MVLVTEWREYRELDPVAVGEARGIPSHHRRSQLRLDATAWRAAGWTYIGMETAVTAHRRW